MKDKKYKFTKADLKLRTYLEKKRGSKIPEEEFYKYIQKMKKWLNEYVKVIKKWVKEKPHEAEQLSKLVKSWEEKEKNKKLYERLAKIKKFTVVQLQKLLLAALKKEGYINLEFSKPEIKKDVIIEFTVQDNKTDREKYDSIIQLQRIIKKNLEKTNWRLMSDGSSYRLGVFTGRFKGVEGEENLKKLVTKYG